MKTDIHIVSTKVLTPECAAKLADNGIHLTQYNFISTKINLPTELHRQKLFPVVVITSVTGVLAWVMILEQLTLLKESFPVYCLANATRKAAVKAGLPIILSAENASQLANEILRDRSITSINFVCSNIRRSELPDRLRRHGVRVHEIQAYQTTLCPVVIKSLYQGVIFFSPSAIESFLSVNSSKDCVAFCIGQTTASSARDSGFTTICVAQKPTQESVIDLIHDFYKIAC